MDKKNIQNILSSPFTVANWHDVLISVFGAKRLHKSPVKIDINKKEKAEAAYELGSFNTSDDRIIGLYLVKVKPEVWLERNKVGLREMLRSVYKHDVDGALIVFEQKDKWRLSLVSEIRVFDENGKISKKATEPKRYTYLLGVGEKVRTPATRIASLSSKPFTLEDIRNAFSVEALNEEFYKIVARFFYQLVGATEGKGAKAITHDRLLELPGIKPNSNEGHKIYQEFAVRLIGRTVFCWFLKVKKSDKGVPLLPEQLLSSDAVSANKNYYHFILEKLFFQTLNTPMDERIKDLPKGCDQIPFLNGGLFEPASDDFYKPNRNSGLSGNINTLKIPDSWFKDFFEHLEQYNFTIDENSVVDIEVSVDPEMLGRIFENLLAEIDPDSGETARKATGSFYTPREIVDYMATQSLVHYLHNQTKIDKESLQPIFKMDSEISFSKPDSEKILEALDRLKILDPACGSGAFPIGVMQKIVMALQKLDKEAVWWKAKQIQRIENAILRKQVKQKLDQTTVEYARKLGIIQNSLYGVDIQPIAAEISKLRCFLTLVVDENIDETKPNRGVEPLPNLEFKFVTADALLKLPDEENYGGLFNSNEDIELLQQIRLDYLQSYGQQKQELKDEFEKVRDRIAKQQLKLGKNIDINSRAYKISSWNPFAHDKVDWFDPLWMYGVKDFDIIIGNPPYIFTRDADFTDEFKKNIADLYFTKLAPKGKKGRSNQSGKINLFALFILRGLFDLKQGGTLTYIVPNNLLRTTTYDLIRKYILENSLIEEIADLGSGVFEKVTASTVIFQLSNRKPKPDSCTKILTNIDDLTNSIFKSSTIKQGQFLKNVSHTFNLFADNKTVKLLDKISDGRDHLGKFCIDIIEGIVAHKHLITDFPTKGSFPLIEGKTVKRFEIQPIRKHILWDIKQIHRTRPDYLWKAPKKILIQRISGGSQPLTACLDIQKNKTFASVNNLLLKQEYENYYEFFLGLLNSRILNWYYATNFSNNSELTVNISKTFLEKLPIANSSLTQRSNIKELVNYIQFLKKLNDPINEFVPNSHISQLFEEVIDALVYELYFEEDFKKSNIAFMKYAERDFRSIEGKSEKETIKIIHAAYQKLREKDNEIRQNLKLMDTRLTDLIMPIKTAK